MFLDFPYFNVRIIVIYALLLFDYDRITICLQSNFIIISLLVGVVFI